MNRFTLHKAGINVNECMQRLKLDKSTFESILITFLDDKNFELMCKAIDEKNVTSAFLHAHSLKGISSNLSMTKLNLDISPIVEILKNDSFEHLEELLPQVKQSYQEVIDILRLESQKT